MCAVDCDSYCIELFSEGDVVPRRAVVGRGVVRHLGETLTPLAPKCLMPR